MWSDIELLTELRLLQLVYVELYVIISQNLLAESTSFHCFGPHEVLKLFYKHTVDVCVIHGMEKGQRSR